MALPAGKRLGPYEITSIIGAGGMGEVYRAKDTRLDRTVAIKILSSHLSKSSDLKQRFEREARAISSLSHAHICGLYDVGSQDGTEFLVMEFLEGETLAHRLNKGPLSTEQMLRFAIQIADALDKAHRQGIVHRDLKPGNIMVTKAGVKLLDFGLAKLRPAGLSAELSSVSVLPTEAREITNEGTILGTIQYMAPEQLEGKEADARSDIFAFGSVLYEMATGKRAFTGNSQASLMSAILKDEPQPISQVQPLAPSALDRVVKTCLAKDPDDRWQSMHDIATELEWIADPSQSKATVPKDFAFTRSNRVPWSITAALFVILLLTILYAFHFLNEQKGIEEEASFFSIAPPPGYSYHPDVAFAISPDGRKLAFVAADKVNQLSLWARDFGAVESKKLTSIDIDTFDLFWSSDNKSIGIYTADNKLRSIELDGSPSRVVCNTRRLLGSSWNQDVIIFANREGLYKVTAAGGTPIPIIAVDTSRQESMSNPYFLPDAHHFLFTFTSSISESSGIYVGSLDSKEKKRILTTVSRVAYTPPGYLIFTEGDSLVAQPFNASNLELSGKAFTIVHRDFQPGLFSVSATDLLAYSNRSFWKRQLMWFDRSGRQISLVGEEIESYVEPTFSPDEKKIAVSILNPNRFDTDLWQVDLLQGGSSRFTFNSSSTDVGAPVWSPDGSTIAYSSGAGPEIDLYLKAADGSRKEELLLASPNRKWVDDWSLDGRYIVYYQVNPTYDLWILPMSGNRKPHPYLETPFDENHAAISPDGSLLAYTSNETGRSEVYVRTFPDPNQGKWQISNSGGDQARWRRDGKELFYMTPDKKLIAVQIQAGKKFQPGTQTTLFRAPVAYNDQNRDRNQYLASGDGQRFLIVSTEISDQPALINVVLNWRSLLK